MKHIENIPAVKNTKSTGTIHAILLMVPLCVFLTTGCERSGNIRKGVADIDGNVYDTVVIGTQVWMAENLRTTRLNDGTAIPLVESDTAWAGLRSPGYCWYGNYEAFFRLNHYGALYNFYAVSSGKLCPAGWHVPGWDEWYVLIGFLGESSAGGKMKEAGIMNWFSPNAGATNESGFNALPGGYRNTYYKAFRNFRSTGHFWFSGVSDAIRLESTSSGYTHESMGSNGVSVRCLKD